ncbi:MAG TPA: hypothetical protein PLK36_10515 [Methanoregulaceae archaeon]|nr:hypothetical protein [Methanoregulaceae archaeon]HQN90496.1 hypothetical protein [Methanoregulaceae archaeon]
MKKLVFGALIALLALLVLPGAVSAGPSDTITVTGSIGAYIDVDVSAASLTLMPNPMTTTEKSAATTNLVVDSSYTSWGVDVSDEKTIENHKGYMVTADATPIPLGTLFEIGEAAGPWYNLNVILTDFFTGSAGQDMTKTFVVRQGITPADPAGTYSITVTFTGASN